MNAFLNKLLVYSIIAAFFQLPSVSGQALTNSDQKKTPLSNENARFFQQVVEDAAPICSDEELKLWRSQGFRSKLTKAELVDILSAISTRIFGAKLNGGWQRYNGCLLGMSDLYFRVGEFKSGYKLYQRANLFDIPSSASSRISGIRRVLDGIAAGMSHHKEPTEELPTELLKSLGKELHATVLSNGQHLQKAFECYMLFADLYFNAGLYDDASSLCGEFIKNRYAKFKGKEALKIRARKIYLMKRHINAELALGNSDNVERFFCRYLDQNLQQKKLWTRAKVEEGISYFPKFDDIWLDCIAVGRGATFSNRSGENLSQPEKMGYFFSPVVSYHYPVDDASQKGSKRKTSAIRPPSPLRKSLKVEDAIKKFLNDSELKKHSTIILLRFVLAEYQVANGRAKAADQTLTKLEKDWSELVSKKTKSDADRRALNSFQFNRFPFDEFRKYLCTYYDNPEFRTICSFAGRWDRHEYFFNYKRPIPNFDDAKKKP